MLVLGLISNIKWLFATAGTEEEGLPEISITYIHYTPSTTDNPSLSIHSSPL